MQGYKTWGHEQSSSTIFERIFTFYLLVCYFGIAQVHSVGQGGNIVVKRKSRETFVFFLFQTLYFPGVSIKQLMVCINDSLFSFCFSFSCLEATLLIVRVTHLLLITRMQKAWFDTAVHDVDEGLDNGQNVFQPIQF